MICDFFPVVSSCTCNLFTKLTNFHSHLPENSNALIFIPGFLQQVVLETEFYLTFGILLHPWKTREILSQSRKLVAPGICKHFSKVAISHASVNFIKFLFSSCSFIICPPTASHLAYFLLILFCALHRLFFG